MISNTSKSMVFCTRVTLPFAKRATKWKKSQTWAWTRGGLALPFLTFGRRVFLVPETLSVMMFLVHLSFKGCFSCPPFNPSSRLPRLWAPCFDVNNSLKRNDTFETT